MAIQKLNRYEIIEKASLLFAKQGYHNTSMEDVAKACDIKKASLYHHIPSRKVLIIEVISRVICQFKSNHFDLAYDEHKAVSSRLTAMLGKIQDFCINSRGHCLVSSLMLEAAREIPEVIPLVTDYFTAWINAIAYLLSDHYGDKRSKELAEDAVSHLHGSIVLGNFFQNFENLKRATGDIAGLLPTDS